MCSDRPRIQNTLESEVQATPIHSHKRDPDKPSALWPNSTLQARSKKAHSSSSTASDGCWCLLECCLRPQADEKTASLPHTHVRNGYCWGQAWHHCLSHGKGEWHPHRIAVHIRDGYGRENRDLLLWWHLGFLAIGRDTILSISNSTILWHILSGLDDTRVAKEESLLSVSRPDGGNGGGDLAVKVIFQASLDTGR